jgi:hypothetical protein
MRNACTQPTREIGRGSFDPPGATRGTTRRNERENGRGGYLALRSTNFPIAAGIDEFSHLTGALGLFRKPAHYRVLAEPPLVANSEARNLALPEKLVKRGRVDPQ